MKRLNKGRPDWMYSGNEFKKTNNKYCTCKDLVFIETLDLCKELGKRRNCVDCRHTTTIVCLSCIWRDIWDMNKNHTNLFSKKD